MTADACPIVDCVGLATCDVRFPVGIPGYYVPAKVCEACYDAFKRWACELDAQEVQHAS